MGTDLGLVLKDVARLRGRRWVLSHVDLQIPSGEVWAIAGANGAGKTTLLRVIASLLPPTRGTVRLNDRDPEHDLEAYRAQIAFLSHRMGMYEELSALENLGSVARLLGSPRSEAELSALCEQVGIQVAADVPVRKYSAGMRKRLALARLTLQKPRVVLLDEPYGQLDDAGFDLVDQMILRWKDEGCAVVLASHLLQRAGAVADRGAVLADGQIRWVGAAADLSIAWASLQAEVAR